MKEYEFVEVNAKGGFVATKFEGHRDIIKSYALRGYQYAGYIPTEMSAHGTIYKMDLVFEKDV